MRKVANNWSLQLKKVEKQTCHFNENSCASMFPRKTFLHFCQEKVACQYNTILSTINWNSPFIFAIYSRKKEIQLQWFQAWPSSLIQNTNTIICKIRDAIGIFVTLFPLECRPIVVYFLLIAGVLQIWWRTKYLSIY